MQLPKNYNNITNKDRLYITEINRGVIDDFKTKNILGFSSTSNSDIFSIAMALGVDSPSELITGKTGYILFDYVDDKMEAMINSLLISKSTAETLNDSVDIIKNCLEAEKCVNSGIASLKKMVDEVEGDYELLVNSLINQLDLKYEAIFKCNN